MVKDKGFEGTWPGPRPDSASDSWSEKKAPKQRRPGKKLGKSFAEMVNDWNQARS